MDYVELASSPSDDNALSLSRLQQLHLQTIAESSSQDSNTEASKDSKAFVPPVINKHRRRSLPNPDTKVSIHRTFSHDILPHLPLKASKSIPFHFAPKVGTTLRDSPSLHLLPHLQNGKRRKSLPAEFTVSMLAADHSRGRRMSDPRELNAKRTTPCGEHGHLFAIPSKVLDIANSMAKQQQIEENSSSVGKIIRSESESIFKESPGGPDDSEKTDTSKSYSSLKGCATSPSSVFNLYTTFTPSRSCVVCSHEEDGKNDFPRVQPREEVV